MTDKQSVVVCDGLVYESPERASRVPKNGSKQLVRVEPSQENDELIRVYMGSEFDMEEIEEGKHFEGGETEEDDYYCVQLPALEAHSNYAERPCDASLHDQSKVRTPISSSKRARTKQNQRKVDNAASRLSFN